MLNKKIIYSRKHLDFMNGCSSYHIKSDEPLSKAIKTFIYANLTKHKSVNITYHNIILKCFDLQLK